MRFIFFHPEKLRSGKPGKRNVGRIPGQRLLTDYLVQIFGLFGSAPVIPQNSGPDYLIRRVQRNKAVHLSAKADARHLASVTLIQKFIQSVQGHIVPVFRILLRPAGLRKADRIFSGNDVYNFSFFIHGQQLYRRRPEINTDIQHVSPPQ